MHTTSVTPPEGIGCKLEYRTVGKIRGLFYVPDYQRGYRWVAEDVNRLLDDLWESEGRPYSLQPVVVKQRPDVDDKDTVWELVDGQQRLTTLFLLLQYMQQRLKSGMGAPYRLRYQTRDESEAYLQNIVPEGHHDDIDLYHLYKSHLAIGEWFARRGDDYEQNAVANTLHGYLFKSVHVIWYELPAEMQNVTDVFTRLNVGRIPLTDSELIKAALLSAVRMSSPERAQECAAQWDVIERDLHDSDIWAFVTGLSETEDERYATRISLLLDTIADQHAAPPFGKRPRYFTFDTLRAVVRLNPTAFWSEVLAAHARVLGWHRQPKTFNKIGFLTAVADDGALAFTSVFKAAKGRRKKEFDDYLATQMRVALGISTGNLEELAYDGGGYARLLKALLLFNVETVSKADERFPFAKHARGNWSLEHIHAQNAESLNKAHQWKDWLNNHRKALLAVEGEASAEQMTALVADIDEALPRINAVTGSFTGQQFEMLSARTLAVLNRDIVADHSIRNLALLARGENSALSNSVFEVKRQLILDFDGRGTYIPVCTRNVFLKYYSAEGAKQPHFWSEDDKEAYAAGIRAALSPYLTESTPA